MSVKPLHCELQPLLLDSLPKVEKVWGIALASHLEKRKVAQRMAKAAQEVSLKAGYHGSMQIQYEDTALQPGAGLALFADLTAGSRLGADMAGAPGRRAEIIGKSVARQLLDEIKSGAAVDRHAADQIIPFAVLAKGYTRLRVAAATGHMESNAWLAREFFGVDVSVQDQMLAVSGICFRPTHLL